MTLAELKDRASAVKIGGRLLPDDKALETYQVMVFDTITQLCDPLNLAIPYQDSDIYRALNEEGCVEWYLRKPRIAETQADYIDIDERLELAFVYYLAAFVAADAEQVELEARADRVCVEYAVEVERMGLPKAKEVYEQESYVSGVRFDCHGKVYVVNDGIVEDILSCLLCGNTCTNAATRGRIDLYKRYLSGESMKPVDIEPLRALDRAVFLYILAHPEYMDKYTQEQLDGVTTLSCELGKLANGEEVEPWVSAEDKRQAAAISTGE